MRLVSGASSAESCTRAMFAIILSGGRIVFGLDFVFCGLSACWETLPIPFIGFGISLVAFVLSAVCGRTIVVWPRAGIMGRDATPVGTTAACPLCCVGASIAPGLRGALATCPGEIACICPLPAIVGCPSTGLLTTGAAAAGLLTTKAAAAGLLTTKAAAAGLLTTEAAAAGLLTTEGAAAGFWTRGAAR